MVIADFYGVKRIGDFPPVMVALKKEVIPCI